MTKHHTEILAEMRQMKALADEMYMRYWNLREQYDQARREFLGNDYVSEEERMQHAVNMGGKVFSK